ncbi:MAG: family 10 glycosylhydrolase [Clostridia bacterium]|nr:family 10 glycosylhydrolase [Clostridia bacterium]
MKKIFLLAVLLLLMTLPCHAAQPEVRGVWVSTVYNLDYPSEPGLSSAQMMAQAEEIITSAARAGINTIYLQVRPCCDAIYPSQTFPSSKYLSGQQGLAPEGGFDPLDYFIDRCHDLGMELHAWINPYRVTVSTFTSIEEGLATLSPLHPARLHPEWVRQGSDGRLYFDPALADVQKLISDGVVEILQNYDVDGIHLDDYFYPDGGLDDKNSFELLGSGYDNIAEFRRDNINNIVRSLDELTDEYGVTFGISPFGIWANSSSDSRGSETIGGQSYFDHYADTLKWIQEGWIDYIAPQLYWAIGSVEGEFETLLLWWRNAVTGTGVDLYIGIGAYRTQEEPNSTNWYTDQELIDQLDMIEIYGQTDGVIYFRYQSVEDNPTFYEHLTDRYARPMPQIGSPLFYSANQNQQILSPQPKANVVNGENYNVQCLGNAGSRMYAMTGDNIVSLTLSQTQYSAPISISDTNHLAVINDRNGVISVAISPVELLDPQNKCSIYDIDCTESGEYTAVTFYTDLPAAAECSYDGRYITLTLSPCKTALLFECDSIKYMVTENKSSGIQYVFALRQKAQDCYIEEYDDRIILYFR